MFCTLNIVAITSLIQERQSIRSDDHKLDTGCLTLHEPDRTCPSQHLRSNRRAGLRLQVMLTLGRPFKAHRLDETYSEFTLSICVYNGNERHQARSVN